MTYRFETKEMQAVFDRFKDDPDRVDVSGELALVRVCLQGVVAKLDGITDAQDIPMETIGFMTQMAKDAADLADRLNRIERGLQVTMNVGQFRALTEQIAAVLMEHVEPDVMERILDGFDTLKWPIQRKVVPIPTIGRVLKTRARAEMDGEVPDPGAMSAEGQAKYLAELKDAAGEAPSPVPEGSPEGDGE